MKHACDERPGDRGTDAGKGPDITRKIVERPLAVAIGEIELDALCGRKHGGEKAARRVNVACSFLEFSLDAIRVTNSSKDDFPAIRGIFKGDRGALLIGRCSAGSLFFQRRKVAFLTAGHETFGDRFQFLPTIANGDRFLLRDLIVSGGGRNDREQISKFLHYFVCRRN